MTKLQSYKFYTLPSDLAAEPKSGKCIAENYWLVDAKGDLIFYNFGLFLSAQCKKDERIAKLSLLSRELPEGCTVAYRSLVFLGSGVTEKVSLLESSTVVEQLPIKEVTTQDFALQRRVLKVVQESLGMPDGDVNLSSTFSNLVMEEIDVVEVVMAIEEEFDIEIADCDCEKWTSVQDIIDYVEGE